MLLKLLHKNRFRANIEGWSHEVRLEARPRLDHQFVWPFEDVYGRRVYGKAVGTMEAGYEYSDCKDIVWVQNRFEVEAGAPVDDKVRNKMVSIWTI
jgi:hypothetical protein